MSRAPPSTCSGEAAVTTVEMRGRARKRSRSPASTSQMRSDGVDLAGAVDEGHVLARLGEQREVLGELALLERHVGRADLRPHDVELRQLVDQRRALAQVLQRAGAALAGAEVERLGDAAAGREVEGLALVQQHVVGLGEAGHQDAPRALAGRPLHQLARQARDAGGVVDLGAALREQRQDRGAGEAHAHAAEQLDRLVDDRALLGFAQPRRVCFHRHLPRELVSAAAAGPCYAPPIGARLDTAVCWEKTLPR